MPIKIHPRGFEFAQSLIKEGKVDHQYGQGKESQHGVTPADTDKYLENHSIHDYGLWFLGINTHAQEGSINQYLYPYGDFEKIHRALVEKIIKQAHKDHHADIVHAAQELLDHIDKK